MPYRDNGFGTPEGVFIYRPKDRPEIADQVGIKHYLYEKHRVTLTEITDAIGQIQRNCGGKNLVERVYCVCHDGLHHTITTQRYDSGVEPSKCELIGACDGSCDDDQMELMDNAWPTQEELSAFKRAVDLKKPPLVTLQNIFQLGAAGFVACAGAMLSFAFLSMFLVEKISMPNTG